MPFSALPAAQGLYDPQSERDACGLAMVADLRGRPTHGTVTQALAALHNLRHRGAAGAEPSSGDGSGLLMQVPDAFYRAVAGVRLPPPGEYATGVAFVPTDEGAAERVAQITAELAAEERLSVLGWREVPTDPTGIGPTARSVMPRFRQPFLAPTTPLTGPLDLERRAFCLRKRLERRTAGEGCAVYLPSLSARTVVYKGMLTTDQLVTFFPDLHDERTATAMALVHSRFSTNTFPSWPLAHPFRYIAHNGEINTIKGNRNWMRAREALLETDAFGGDLSRLLPVCTDGASDSASFDEVLELLHLSGRSLPHAVLMMIPEAWENNTEMDPCRRGFYEFHASLMEPWDGPAGVAFTDGTLVGAVLDRNGLRPARWWRTADDRVILASEAGVLDVDPAEVVAKGRLRPGRMFLVDTAAGRIVEDDEIKNKLAAAEPYRHWVAAGMVTLAELPPRDYPHPRHEDTLRRQQIFGYTEEELRVLLEPMAATGAEATGSMGTDTPVAVLSQRPRLLYDYFSQLFAQVTNPPLDAIREELVTSLSSTIGPDVNLLAEVPEAANKIVLPFPVLANDELAKVAAGTPSLPAVTVRGLYEVDGGGAALAEAITRVRAEVVAAIEGGARIVLLTDRGSDAAHAPIPSLLLTAAVHHHLVRERLRTNVGLVVETGDCREVHHAALLIGYGAGAINPYLAMETVEQLFTAGRLPGIADPAAAARNLVRALGKGVLKVMSKMGISTVASYTGAQVFEALGLSEQVVDDYFTGTSSRLGGVGLDVLAEEVAVRHRLAYPRNPAERAHRGLETGGEYQWRREGEVHLFNPETVFLLQHATRSRRYEVFRRYTQQVDALSAEAATLRGLFRLRRDARPSIPVEEVEPVSSIVRRFSTGAMSYGSISIEAHETLAVAMNTLGGRSNSGEGGEDSDRLRDPLRRSAVKQVASGRFGVTSEYLASADDIQIKMAQGAKPGEGGQLPGSKVYPWIAKTRHSTPGVGLISPPPHHDIYSIEDLKQLIYDLKMANQHARVSVKLVAEVGVGTVAAGVAKAHADVVLISGHDGGTGASPLTSIKHAGIPWELGLAETHQVLVMNDLRSRIVVEVDGQLKTGRDVVVGALLGAEEFGFATAPLVALGCLVMRACHLNTCPVGVATQDPELRKRFAGDPNHVVNFMRFIAQEVREHMARLGFRTIDEMIGRSDRLEMRPALDHWKARGLDFARILAQPEVPSSVERRQTISQDHGVDDSLDATVLLALAQPALTEGLAVTADLPVRNVDRTVGTMLGSEITRHWGRSGLPEDTVRLRFTGSAGQSFGAFIPPGLTLELDGDTNDYVGKGLSGGRIVVRPHAASPFKAHENVIAGNVALYGATGGEAFIRGVAGERFAVRNSGAVAVVEGIGDHGCEYMTGGRVLVIGRTGRNFAAGMSGGVAWVFDPEGTFAARCNTEMVGLEHLADDPDDTAAVHELLIRHRDLTGSERATQLLENWSTTLPCFIRVVPHDYRRVLEAQARMRAAGMSVEEAEMAAFEENVLDLARVGGG